MTDAYFIYEEGPHGRGLMNSEIGSPFSSLDTAIEYAERLWRANNEMPKDEEDGLAALSRPMQADETAPAECQSCGRIFIVRRTDENELVVEAGVGPA
jgi:hypothetical protein